MGGRRAGRNKTPTAISRAQAGPYSGWKGDRYSGEERAKHVFLYVHHRGESLFETAELETEQPAEAKGVVPIAWW